jgi:hypothetical protein
MYEDLVIDETNFNDYFFDVRKHAPKRGQVMACYTATAELIEGNLKRDLVYLLSMTDKVNESVQLLRKIGLASEEDSVRVCREIAEDLNAGLVAKEIMNKVYEYKFQAFYYTDKELVPMDNPAWSIVDLRNLDEHIDKLASGHIITSKVNLNPSKEEIEAFKKE